MPDFLQPLFGSSPRASAIFYGVIGGLLLVAWLVLWQVLGRGPRRRRGLKRARRRLAEGAWPDAVERIRKLRHLGAPSAAWQRQFNVAEADCLKVAADLALQDKKFEESLGHRLRVAELLGEAPLQAKLDVQSAMLEELRRLFTLSSLGETRAMHELIARILLVQAPCREASFWQGMCFLRGGEPQRALEAFQTARSGEGRSLVLDDGLGELPTANPVALPSSSVIEPPLYLGAMLLRQGQAKESLRYLTEANRIDGNCPIVTLQLGAAMIGAGGDTQLAVRALNRALRGLQTWTHNPKQAWVEAFPEGRSFIRRLAAKHPFTCPLFGPDLTILTQQGNLALAQGLYKLNGYQEAADLFAKVLQNGAPSLPVLRGLGLSLARVGKYDDAFKHLRIAHEMEELKDRVTAGYLALCGAKGKPTRAEDKARNILWAIRTVAAFNAPGDREWVALISALFAEARAENLALGLDDQLYLCEHLLSVEEADPQAAQAYHYLQATFPQAVRSEYAWLYCRAAQQHKVEGDHALALFARTFFEAEQARAFFEKKQWDMGEVEFTYLERAARLDPGHFPAALGADYSPRGEQLLLERAERLEKAGQAEAALACAEVLHRLAPGSPRALDRLAFLHHRQDRPDEAVTLLEKWHTLHPGDPQPLVRSAFLLHQRGAIAQGRSKMREALALAQGKKRARLAFLAARLTLQGGLLTAGAESNGSPPAADGPDPASLATAQEFLELCLHEEADYADALWCLAAVRWLRGDVAGLARQAAVMNQEQVADVRFHFFAALCRLAAHDFTGLLQTCSRIASSESGDATDRFDFSVRPNGPVEPAAPRVAWPVETAYLTGLAQLGLEQYPGAADVFKLPAQTPDSPSAAHAQALLGGIHFQEKNHEEAARWWLALDPKKRAAWKLGESLAGTVFLTALEAYAQGNFEQAADKLRSAGKLGCRDRRLGALLVQALFKAGQQLVYAAMDPLS